MSETNDYFLSQFLYNMTFKLNIKQPENGHFNSAVVITVMEDEDDEEEAAAVLLL